MVFLPIAYNNAKVIGIDMRFYTKSYLKKNYSFNKCLACLNAESEGGFPSSISAIS